MRMFLCLLFLLLPQIALATPTDTSTATIDLNTAPAAALVDLPGIGEKRARQIVELRKKRRFVRVEDLRWVKGVGKKTIAKLRPRVLITPTPVAPSSSPKSSPPPNRRRGTWGSVRSKAK